MDRVAIGGLSLQGAGLQQLERLRGTAECQSDEFLRELADALFASELVLLSTCNRVEVIFAREEGHAPSLEDLPLLAAALGAEGELASQLNLVIGRSAFLHLFRVACSLDSVVQGEDQILGQVRTAFMRSEALGLTGALLEPLFEAALQVGKQVRSQTELSRHPVSIMSVGAALLRARMPRGEQPAIVAVLGAGMSGRLLAQALRDQGFEVGLIVNRTLARARSLAGEFKARALSLQEFQETSAEALGGIDVLASITGAPGYVVSRRQLIELAQGASGGAGLFGLDLALPRDLEPCGPGQGVEIIDLDEVQRGAAANRALRAAAAREAEALVARKLTTFERKEVERRVTEEIASYLQDNGELIERELKNLTAGPLASLPEGARAGVLHWAHGAFGRANHLSLSFCKRMARSAPQFDAMDEEETTG